MTVADGRLLSIGDYERRARSTLPVGMWKGNFGDYGDALWQANTNNVDGFAATVLKPRVMVDVSRRDLTTTALGIPMSLPVLIGPASMHARVHPDGELATARAAAAAQTIMAISTASSYSIEEVAAVATGPIWFQLYITRDRRCTERLIRRAEDAGYSAIVFTVDLTAFRADRGLALSESTQQASHLVDEVLANFREMDVPGAEMPTIGTWPAMLDQALTWADIEWIRSQTSLPIVIKGIQCGADARLARENGVDAMVVSNHGGFALWDSRATVSMLPEVVAEAGPVEVYLDGGVRHGTDVLKALALGARAVLIGRANFWGLAVGGAQGAAQVLEILREELDVAMCQCGVTDVKQVDPALVG